MEEADRMMDLWLMPVSRGGAIPRVLWENDLDKLLGELGRGAVFQL